MLEKHLGIQEIVQDVQTGALLNVIPAGLAIRRRLVTIRKVSVSLIRQAWKNILGVPAWVPPLMKRTMRNQQLLRMRLKLLY